MKRTKALSNRTTTFTNRVKKERARRGIVTDVMYEHGSAECEGWSLYARDRTGTKIGICESRGKPHIVSCEIADRLPKLNETVCGYGPMEWAGRLAWPDVGVSYVRWLCKRALKEREECDCGTP